MIFKKNLAFFILFLLIIALNSFAAYSEKGYPLTVSSSSFLPAKLYAGNEASIILNLKNSSAASTIENIKIKIKAPKEFNVITDEIEIESLQPNETTTVVFKAKAKENATEGTYIFTFFFDYNLILNKNAISISDNTNVSVTLQGVYSLKIKQIKASNLRPHILEPFTLTALIENYSGTEAKNIVVNLTNANLANFILVDGTQRSISSLKGNSTTEVSFTLIPSRNITVGNHLFNVDVNCENCVKSTESLAIEVLGKPNLIISGIDYSIEGKNIKTLMQGDSFSIAVQLDNIGEEKAKAVQVFFDIDESITGTKKVFVGSIEPDDSGSAVFDLKIKENASEGYHNAKIRVEFLDELDEKKSFNTEYPLFIEKKPPESPVVLLLIVLAILVVLYFIIKMILRWLTLKRLQK